MRRSDFRVRIRLLLVHISVLRQMTGLPSRLLNSSTLSLAPFICFQRIGLKSVSMGIKAAKTHGLSPALAPWTCVVMTCMTSPMYTSVTIWACLSVIGMIAAALLITKGWKRHCLPLGTSRNGRRWLSGLAAASLSVFFLRAVLLWSLSTVPPYEDYGMVEPPAMSWLSNRWITEHGDGLWWGSSATLLLLTVSCAAVVVRLRSMKRQELSDIDRTHQSV